MKKVRIIKMIEDIPYLYINMFRKGKTEPLTLIIGCPIITFLLIILFPMILMVDALDWFMNEMID